MSKVVDLEAYRELRQLERISEAADEALHRIEEARVAAMHHADEQVDSYDIATSITVVKEEDPNETS